MWNVRWDGISDKGKDDLDDEVDFDEVDFDKDKFPPLVAMRNRPYPLASIAR